ncbi:MAG: hypothetical protein HQK75_01340 [Candidatus Magnetomorum sp.]|nr:hypothetical protein [Candidatus Magnetomorum sp.]
MMNIQMLVPKQTIEHKNLFKKFRTLAPFSDGVIEFVSAFSSKILVDQALKKYPELIALGFWMRKSSIRHYKEIFESKNEGRIKLARGTVFHIAPSNVDTIFIYSLFISLLMGNANIVRISQHSGKQTELLITVLNELLGESQFAHLQNYIQLVSFDHDSEILTKLSASCDARVIWGGDETIALITRVPIPPKAIDIKFANKYSFTLLNGKSIAVLTNDERNILAKKFVNDSYSFGQMACSSPRAVIWIESNAIVRKQFWEAVERQIDRFDHNLHDVDFINKLVFEYGLAIEKDIKICATGSNKLSVLWTDLNTVFDLDAHCGSGLFLESKITSLHELSSLLTKDFQTVSYYGIEKEQLIDWISSGLNGIDRLVPVGQALDFYPVWDGFDLSEFLTREVTVL